MDMVATGTTDVWTDPVIAFDKPSYNKGDLMTLTATGIADTETEVSELPATTLTLTFTAADGATQTTKATVATVFQTTVSSPTVGLTSIVDDSGRIWTVNPGTLQATATA